MKIYTIRLCLEKLRWWPNCLRKHKKINDWVLPGSQILTSWISVAQTSHKDDTYLLWGGSSNYLPYYFPCQASNRAILCQPVKEEIPSFSVLHLEGLCTYFSKMGIYLEIRTLCKEKQKYLDLPLDSTLKQNKIPGRIQSVWLPF